jgi:hypothetical protein
MREGLSTLSGLEEEFVIYSTVEEHMVEMCLEEDFSSIVMVGDFISHAERKTSLTSFRRRFLFCLEKRKKGRRYNNM